MRGHFGREAGVGAAGRMARARAGNALLLANLDAVAAVLGQQHAVAHADVHGQHLAVLGRGAGPHCHHLALVQLLARVGQQDAASRLRRGVERLCGAARGCEWAQAQGKGARGRALGQGTLRADIKKVCVGQGLGSPPRENTRAPPSPTQTHLGLQLNALDQHAVSQGNELADSALEA